MGACESIESGLARKTVTARRWRGGCARRVQPDTDGFPRVGFCEWGALGARSEVAECVN